jgi:D-alanyl-D-alanine carboxypeptidase/D-alanyl-D-alanine-endopeptidase (penicillin-binding protein 4)
MPQTSKFRCVALSAAAVCLALAATPAAAKDAKKSNGKTASADTLIKRSKLPKSSVGYVVIDAKTGKLLEGLLPDSGFIPASAIKAPTAVATIGILGADHRFQTQMLMRGTVKGGTLRGALYLRGGGDPVLTTDDLQAFVAALRDAGVTRLDGKYIYDDSALPPAKAIDPSHANDVAYNPSVGGLSLNFNRVKIKWQRTGGKDGPKLDAKVISKTDKTQIEVDFLKVGFAPKGSRAPRGLIYRETGDRQEWLMLRSVKRKGEIWVPIKYAGQHAAYVFRKLAEEAGIKIPPAQRGKTPGDAKPLHTVKSVPLTRIASKVLYFSNNMGAEMMGLAAARKIDPTIGSVRDAGVVLGAWLQAKAKGINWAGYDVHNNSGLSTQTRTTPRQLSAILRFARSQKFGGKSFADLLKPYYIGRKREGVPGFVKVRAKTGTINYAIAVAGYLHTRKKRDVIFALFISDYSARRAAAKAGTKYKTMRPRSWMYRARALRRALVRRWALTY